MTTSTVAALPGMPAVTEDDQQRSAPRRRVAIIPFQARPEVIRRFEAKIIRTSGCWWWTGAIAGGGGYGCFAHYHSTVVGAHRWALELELGRRLTDDEVAAHGCDEPLCVRVGDGHLAVATPEQNIAHMVLRGRRRGPWVNDSRGADGRSRAIRDALKAAVATGTDIDAAVAAAKAAGDPHANQTRLF